MANATQGKHAVWLSIETQRAQRAARRDRGVRGVHEVGTLDAAWSRLICDGVLEVETSTPAFVLSSSSSARNDVRYRSAALGVRKLVYFGSLLAFESLKCLCKLI